MKIVLFDMGRVLLHLDYETAWSKLRRHCPPGKGASFENGFRIMFHDPVTACYERGETGVDDVYQKLVEVTGFAGTRLQFEEIWCGIFSANRPMIDFAEKLADHHTLYLWSNSNELHEQYTREHFPEIFACLSGEIFSHHIHALKPDPAFFEKALEILAIQQENCVFIDDLAENVEAARACGIPSVQYTKPTETIHAVRCLLREK